ncbi:DCC1-like thiol-disulfide oxidoreductase family protein [Breoghania sp.]|uniref:DCC1-like thiol-disulfide oxidoreductase family protein n=1 Tax=Breoghania sp. TaxID=2065378 RepID=UPI00260DFEF0|nr:DCC1-like thiol-disulfide oxidoreductase family protein [Breoghania sp.]MDJ0933093.1 DCC1-like thiol-disulfide oxidoreductase family protein [Breoghania sp.]
MSGIEIIYDGGCTFCSRYVTMTQLRDAIGTVELIDARSDHPFVAKVRAQGYDLNEGMLARYKGREYFGADCLHLLSMLSSRSGLDNRLMSTVMAHRPLAVTLYPALRLGRNMTLRLLGRQPIS